MSQQNLGLKNAAETMLVLNVEKMIVSLLAIFLDQKILTVLAEFVGTVDMIGEWRHTMNDTDIILYCLIIICIFCWDNASETAQRYKNWHKNECESHMRTLNILERFVREAHHEQD